MIPSNSIVLKKSSKKTFSKLVIDSVKVGHYIKGIKLSNGSLGDYKVLSIVKVNLPRYEIKTSCFDTLLASKSCKFFCLDGLATPWSPEDTIDTTTRFFKREPNKVLIPFVKSCKFTGFQSTFYDILIEANEPVGILVDGYAKIFESRFNHV